MDCSGSPVKKNVKSTDNELCPFFERLSPGLGPIIGLKPDETEKFGCYAVHRLIDCEDELCNKLINLISYYVNEGLNEKDAGKAEDIYMHMSSRFYQLSQKETQSISSVFRLNETTVSKKHICGLSLRVGKKNKNIINEVLLMKDDEFSIESSIENFFNLYRTLVETKKNLSELRAKSEVYIRGTEDFDCKERVDV